MQATRKKSITESEKSGGTMPDNTEDKKERPVDGRRVRSMLKSYYGVSDGDTSTSSDPSNIDTAAFDPDKYFDGLLKVSSLSELVSKDSEMVSEIKSLDGDMKTLVYENYNKFISATDTIRKMKSNVENMEAEMIHLSKNMDKITECSDRINNTLSTRRDKIEQLSGVHRLLQKLQFLVALPARLTQCIQMQSYAQAVKYYTITGGILGQYKHLPSFHAIHIECNRIIDELRIKLRDRIKDSQTPPPEVSEAADLLIELNEPTDVLRNLYLSGRRTNVETLLKTFSDQAPQQLSVFIPEFSTKFLAALLYTQQSYRSLFINRFDTSGLTYAEKEVSSKLLDEFSKDMFSRFVAVVKSKFGGEYSPNEKILGLEALHNSILRVNSQITELAAADKVADIVNNTVHTQISNYFTKLQVAVAGHIQAMCEALTESKTQPATPQAATDAKLSFSELSERTCKAIISEIHALFDSVRPFMSSEAKFLTAHYGVLYSRIQVKMQQFFLFLNIHMLEYIGEGGAQPSKPVKVSARFVLQLVGVSLYIETRGLQQVLQLNNDLSSLVSKKGGASGDPSAFSAADLAKLIRETSQKLLSNYVRMQGTKISSMLRKGIETTLNWLKMKEPRDVRLVIELVLDEITKMGQEINSVFSTPTASAATAGNSSPPVSSLAPPAQRGARTPTMPGYQPPGAAGGSVRKNPSVGGNMSTLFDKKVNIFAPVEFNANSVIIGIVNIGLKTMYECVRMRTFGRNGYQQIQVELYFMKIVLWSIVGKNTAVDQLLDEVERSVIERCVDPIPMEQSIISRLCEGALEKRNVPTPPAST